MTDTKAISDSLTASYMLVEVEIRSYSGNRIDRAVSEEVINNKGAQRDAGKFVKYLFAGADHELKAVQAQGARIRQYIYDNSLPWSNNSDGIKRGARLIPATQAIEFLGEISKIKKEYDAAVLQLQSVWDARITEACTRLGSMADKAEYPMSDQVPSLFGVIVDLRPIPAMEDFSRINVPANLAAALGARGAEADLKRMEGAMEDLKGRVLESVQHMADALGKHGAGEKTRLYESMQTNLKSHLNLVRAVGATKPELIELADKIDAALLQRPVESLRTDKAAAAEVAQAASALAIDVAVEDVWKF